MNQVYARHVHDYCYYFLHKLYAHTLGNFPTNFRYTWSLIYVNKLKVNLQLGYSIHVYFHEVEINKQTN